MTKRIFLVGAAAALMTSVVVGGSLAANQAAVDAPITAPLKAATLSIEWDGVQSSDPMQMAVQDAQLMPGDQIALNDSYKVDNTGDVDSYIRVTVTKYWADENGQKDVSLDAAEENAGYVVTFRPGEHGSFTQGYKDSLQAAYGSSNYRESLETGAVAVRVKAGESLPAAPSVNDIIVDEAVRQRYVVTNPASGYAGGTAYNDLDAVAEYTLRASSEEAMFTVRHLDEETGEEIAHALKGMTPVGQVLAFYAVNNVEHYTAKIVSQSIQLNADESKNEIAFYYTADVNEVTKTEKVGGGTVVQYEDKVVIGGAAVIGENHNTENTENVSGQTEDVTTIPEEDTPKAEFDQDEELVIDDNETPKANLPETAKSANGNMPLVIGGGFLLLLFIIVGLILVNRHNKMVDEK